MIRLIAIIRGVESKDICAVIKTLLENNITEIEVSLSDEKMGLDCIRKAAESFRNSKLNLGVGTVINKRQVDLALQAGARYIITPGWDAELVQYIQSKSVPVIPGVFSPADVMQAINLDIKMAKLFPANFLGPKYIKALSGPYPGIQFLAVGGVNLATIKEYIEGGFAGLGLGSCLIPRGATAKDVMKIEANAKTIKAIIKEFDEKPI